MNTTRPTLCVFAKVPEPGQVKTRLARTIGDARAVELAWAFFHDAIALAESLSSVRVVLVLAGDPARLPESARRLETWSQGEGDLGARLERALRRALETSPAALVMGTDSPGLSPSILNDGLVALHSHDAVLGPAEDGGFYMLGVKQCPQDLLAGVPWSANDTRDHTLARLHSRGWSVFQTPLWFDVDVVPDLARLTTLLRLGSVHAPATARALGISQESP